MRRSTSASDHEGGFTLIEMLISVGIGALLLSVLVTALWQVNAFTLTYRDSASANHQLQGAATWLNRDAVSARSGSVAPSSLTLYIPTYSIGQTEPVTTTVTYALAGGNLVRTSTRPASSSSMVVARDVATVDFGPSSATLDATLYMTVTATVRSETRTATLAFHRRVTE
ncbi:MAG: prepilin-type N-terminal cleavage/methylation domain-containing protein [Anaerolineae bacterium]